MKKYLILFTVLLLAAVHTGRAQASRPRLMLTESGVSEIRSQLGTNPLTDAAYAKAKGIADRALLSGVEVPEPLHVGGGYSHEKHKANYTDMYNAGIMYQLTGEEKYAEFVRQMLLGYASIYPGLPAHPAAFTKTPGKIFYQVLNEAVWLTFTACAYDCVYTYIPAPERKFIEDDLFRPLVAFMEDGVPANRDAFNSMHNFGTWMAAGTGMIGYVMDEPEFVEKALLGSDRDGSSGFLVQLDELFSPDGYYDEGPGYQRYAIYPFVAFAECIDRNQPELAIFDRRDGILRKAVNTLLQCTYEGDIFLMNDAIPKNIHTYEVLFSTNIGYRAHPGDKGLLGMIERQGIITLTDAGAAAAAAIARGESAPFDFRSEMIRIGTDGRQGGLGIIRGHDANNSCVTLKATTHGGGHGHFDRLSMIYYGNGGAVIPDYGSARFINVDVKAKGGYAPENKTFAQLSIAHNTVTVDSTTHFRGVTREALKQGARVGFSDFTDGRVQIMSAYEDSAYEGVTLHRTIAMLGDDAFAYPVVLVIFRMESDKPHTYDLPYYYNGHFMSSSYPYEKNTTRIEPMGRRNGYQHLWKEAVGDPSDAFMQLCWLENERFYTLSSTATNPCTPYFVVTGANDPDYNLVTRNGVIYRNTVPTGRHTIVSLIEPHGNYDLVTETTVDPDSGVENLRILSDNADHSVISIELKNGRTLILAVAHEGDRAARHSVEADGRVYEWEGHYRLFDNL